MSDLQHTLISPWISNYRMSDTVDDGMSHLLPSGGLPPTLSNCSSLCMLLTDCLDLSILHDVAVACDGIPSPEELAADQLD